MKLTAEETLMYEVMKAIYDSGIPIDFKGSMVLKACLNEAGYAEEIRHTVDIDANWNSDTPPSAAQMTDSLQKALSQNGLNLTVSLYRMYGEGRSAGFELKNSETAEILFSMDIDVNRPIPPTQIYEIEGFRFRGVSPTQMLADKISVISGGKVFRRIKDLVDLYYISKVIDFEKGELLQTLESSKRSLDSFDGFLHQPDELRHAYEKFRFTGNVDKPPFEEVYSTVKSYIQDVLPQDEESFCQG
ncbi:MAG: nucleotidyl transferase AbiEii/AbiGii toxin family protein [Lachnospiraceae bacterium]|nr:nucleotidyl transferase AbiEii/AbiGii toxin family protein [Lachnospiraceae bacterium]